MKRKRFNRVAICRADGNSRVYETSHKAHKEYLKERHASFEINIKSTDNSVDVNFSAKYKTIIVLGRPITITMEEYIKCKF